MNRPLERLWVIAYDICEDTTRRHIHDLLQNHGQWVQYSVFECWLGKKMFQGLRKEVQQPLQEDDQVRWYPLCQGCRQQVQWQGKGERAEDRKYYLL